MYRDGCVAICQLHAEIRPEVLEMRQRSAADFIREAFQSAWISMMPQFAISFMDDVLSVFNGNNAEQPAVLD
jgi:hypothetical protein